MINQIPSTENQEQLYQLLNRTRRFHREVAKLISTTVPIAEPRFVVSFQSGLLSMEHAIGAYLLLTQDIYGPGFSLYRPQFETLVRGIWLLHAASESWVEKLCQPLTVESAQKANQTPMLNEMLVQLEVSDAPVHIVQQLAEFRDVTWKALNSFAHGGIHPIARTIEGYPPELAIDAIRNSNALITIAAQLMLIASCESADMEPIHQLVSEFADCIPVV